MKDFVTPPLPAGRTFTLAFLALLAAGLAVAYAHCIRVGFEFDDWHTIESNPAIRSLRHIPDFFVDPTTMTVVRENLDVRPLLVTTYALNYALSGLDPWSYHALNLLIHFAAAVLVFFAVRDYVWWPSSERGASGRARLPAAAAALFFALAPLNSDSVVYVSSRSAVLCTALYLAAFLLALRGRWSMMALLHAGALLTKAIAVTLPATILTYDFLYRDRTRYPTLRKYLSDWRRLLLPVGLPAALNVAYLVYRRLALGSIHLESYAQSFVTAKIWFMSQWSAYLYYVRLFLWPSQLSIDHDFPYALHLTDFRAWGALVVILAWIALAVGSSRRSPIFAFGTLWFFLTLAPESTILPLAEVVNDHRPYIATSLGLSVLLAWLLYHAAERFARRPAFAYAALVGAIVCAAIPMTRYRTWQWEDSLRLWRDAVEKGPGNGRAWMNAGLEFLARDDIDEARRHFEKARELAPRYPFVYMNLSVLARREGRLDEALLRADEAVRLSPGLGRTHFYRGSALEGLGRNVEAAAAYRRAAELSPDDPGPKEALVRFETLDADAVEMNQGVQALHVDRDPPRAITHFRNVLLRNAAHYGATYQLASALDAAGRSDEARRVWQKALTLAQTYDDRAGAEAIRKRLGPSGEPDAEALMAAGLDSFYKRGDPTQAVVHFRKVLAQMPTHYGATYQLAAALDAAARRDEARSVWERVRSAADQIGDVKTAESARARLESRP